MKGVMMPSVSAGSSQREASVMCTPQVMVPSGAAVAGETPARSAKASTSIGATREGRVLKGASCGRRVAPSRPRRPEERKLLLLSLVGPRPAGAQFHEPVQQIEPERRAERGADGRQQPTGQQRAIERLPV